VCVGVCVCVHVSETDKHLLFGACIHVWRDPGRMLCVFCMCVFFLVRVYVYHTCVYMYVHVYICMSVCMYTIYVYIHVYICMSAGMSGCT
jgi:hypothetical protein